MNNQETTRLLQLRAQLTRVGYVNDTVHAWTQALADLSAPEATAALMTLVDAGEQNITVPAIRNQLRKARSPEPTPPAERDTGCRCQPPQHGLPHGAICDMHRRIGLDAIATIRAQRKPR